MSAPCTFDAVTCEDVRRWLVACFLILPGQPIYTSRMGAGAFLNPNTAPGSTMDWVAYSADVLGRSSRERLWLLTWARCEARRRAIERNLPNPPGGGTIADFCREFGLQRSTFDRTVERACRRVAAARNRLLRQSPS